jgi:hypothetical protein
MTTSAPTLVVLAAGMSSRFNKDAAPGDAALKQVVGFGPHGETILDYSVFDALRAGFQKAVFVIRREFESEFRRNVTDKFAGAIAVDFAFQEIDDIPRHLLPADFTAATRAKPWGTGHAVLASRHVVNEPVGVINADDFYGRSSFEKLAGFLRQPDLDSMPCRNCMVGFPMRPTLSDHGRVARGVCTVVTKTQIQSGRPRTAAVPGDIQRATPGTAAVCRAPPCAPFELCSGHAILLRAEHGTGAASPTGFRVWQHSSRLGRSIAPPFSSLRPQFSTIIPAARRAGGRPGNGYGGGGRLRRHGARY